MNAEIKKILSGLKVSGSDIPTAHLKYTGNSKTYVTWTIISEQPILSGNDTELYSIVSVDIDIFSDKNYSSIANEIKRLFTQSDWSWSEDSAEMYEEDTQLYHKTITFEKEKEITWQE